MALLLQKHSFVLLHRRQGPTNIVGHGSFVKPSTNQTHSLAAFQPQQARQNATSRRLLPVASASPGAGSSKDKLDTLQKSLMALEAERDDVISIAEASAKTCVKLSDTLKLMEDLALEKVRSGDEYGAKQLLQERTALKEILDKTSAKAQSNFALASRLAQLIGDKQNQLLQLIRPESSAATQQEPLKPYPPIPSFSGPAYSTSPAYSSVADADNPWATPRPSSSKPAPADTSSFGSSRPPKWQESLEQAQERMRQQDQQQQVSQETKWQDSLDQARARLKQQQQDAPSDVSTFGSNRPPKWQESLEQARGRLNQQQQDAPADISTFGSNLPPKWQESLEQARERMRQQESAAASAGRQAKLSAEESIAAARERLNTRSGNSIETMMEARERLKRTQEQSIAEAQERLRKQDAEILEYCRRIVARYKRGEYVADAELEFAFDQLERRLK